MGYDDALMEKDSWQIMVDDIWWSNETCRMSEDRWQSYAMDNNKDRGNEDWLKDTSDDKCMQVWSYNYNYLHLFQFINNWNSNFSLNRPAGSIQSLGHLET